MCVNVLMLFFVSVLNSTADKADKADMADIAAMVDTIDKFNKVNKTDLRYKDKAVVSSLL